jgi:hypothetical protein
MTSASSIALIHEEEGRDSLRNIGNPLHTDMTAFPSRLNCFLSKFAVSYREAPVTKFQINRVLCNDSLCDLKEYRGGIHIQEK